MTSVSTDRRFGVNSGSAVKVPVKAATTAAITLSGEQTIDGVSCVTDDRVLVKDQASSVANGIYTVDTGAWSRATDFDATYDVVEGTLVHVNQGTTNGESMWRVGTSGTITIDTSSIAFERAVVNESSSITFTQSGSATSRTAQGKMRDIVSILDFIDEDLHAGIKARTDTTDLSADLDEAIASLSAGGVVYFPPGKYNYATELDLPYQAYALGLEGAGADATELAYSGSAVAIEIGDGGASDANWYSVKHLTLSGNANATDAIKLNHTRFTELHSLEVVDFTKADAIGLNIVSGVANYFADVRHCKFRNIPTGIKLSGGTGVGANSNYISFCHFGVHSTYAIHNNAGDTNIIQGCEFNGSITTAIFMEGDADDNKILFNQFDGPTTAVNVSAAACSRTVIAWNSPGTVTISNSGTDTVIIDGSNTVFLPNAVSVGGYVNTAPTDGIGVKGDVRSSTVIRGGYTTDAANGEVDIGAVGPGGQAGVQLNRTNGAILWLTGADTPEGAVTAPVGSLFTRTNGGANTTLYIKESGAGNTGWVAK